MNLIQEAVNFVAGGISNTIFQEVAKWTLGVSISAWVAVQIKKFFDNLSGQVLSKLKSEIATLDDENLRQAAVHVVRYVASTMPNASNSEKLDYAIKKVQEITPDILVSDEKVKVIIESVYAEFKKELSQFTV